MGIQDVSSDLFKTIIVPPTSVNTIAVIGRKVAAKASVFNRGQYYTSTCKRKLSLPSSSSFVFFGGQSESECRS